MNLWHEEAYFIVPSRLLVLMLPVSLLVMSGLGAGEGLQASDAHQALYNSSLPTALYIYYLHCSKKRCRSLDSSIILLGAV